MFNLPTYRITPSAHPVKCPPQCPSPIHRTPHPPPLPPTLVHFPELRLFMFCLPFWYFPHISSPFPSIPFHYYLYSPNEWEHIMFVLLRLTHFTQHNTLQFHPRWSKWWVFVISNGWVLFHCIHRPHLLYSFIFREDFYLFIHERPRERQRHRQRERQAPCMEPASPSASVSGCLSLCVSHE